MLNSDGYKEITFVDLAQEEKYLSTRPNHLHLKISCDQILKQNGYGCQLKFGKATITLNVHSNTLLLLGIFHISRENNIADK